jgi:hypothetical protein
MGRGKATRKAKNSADQISPHLGRPGAVNEAALATDISRKARRGGTTHQVARSVRSWPVSNSKTTPNVNAFTDGRAFARTLSRCDLRKSLPTYRSQK